MSDKICGAKTRSGKPCRSKVLGSNGRCRMHGGTNGGAGKGNKNALKHGIYSRVIDPKDLDNAADMQGSIGESVKTPQISGVLGVEVLRF